jgi:hypothetical protein
MPAAYYLNLNVFFQRGKPTLREFSGRSSTREFPFGFDPNQLLRMGDGLAGNLPVWRQQVSNRLACHQEDWESK